MICCWQLGDVLVDLGPGSCLPTLLEALAHDGASGSLVRRWPEIEVHERAPRGISWIPSRLLESARWLCGEDMDRRWGEFLPVPESQLRVLHGGERLFGAGGFEVAYTPGHASHHVSYLHDDTAFVG